ncbi:MAG TPA: GNAT family N-acetyltransferase [Mucilaginibacter sp.]|nr:GNAT family N-acetyltransferase [Mucilaginibacter sp.]
MDFAVNRLTSADIDLAKQLFWFFQEDDGISRPVIPTDDYLRDLLSKDYFHVLVALYGDILIGGVTGYELTMYKREIKEMFLYEIAVKPTFREKGVAKALIERLKHVCKEKGIEEMYVGTSTPNKAAMALYASTGGEQEPDIAWFVYQCS